MTTINYSLEAYLDTAALLAELNPVLADGQLGKETDTGRFKIGDGVKHWSGLTYAVSNNTSSVWAGPTADVKSLLVTSPDDGGVALPRSTLNTAPIIQQVLDGVLSNADRTAFAIDKEHQLATLIMAVFIKRIGSALGTDFATTLFGPGYTGLSIQDQLAAISALVNGNKTKLDGLIADTGDAGDHVWSSTKTKSEITTAVNALRAQLVGNAGEALDTIYEIANALQNNAGIITTITQELANSVKMTAQSLTAAQKLQVYANLAILSRNQVGYYDGVINLETGSSTLADDYGSDPSMIATQMESIISTAMGDFYISAATDGNRMALPAVF